MAVVQGGTFIDCMPKLQPSAKTSPTDPKPPKGPSPLTLCSSSPSSSASSSSGLKRKSEQQEPPAAPPIKARPVPPPLQPKDSQQKPAPKARPTTYLKLDVLEQNQAQVWVERVLQSAMMDNTDQGALLTRAHQLKPSVAVLHTTGMGVALNTSWLWAGLTPTQDKKRRELAVQWQATMRQEKQDHKGAGAKNWLDPSLKKSLLISQEFKVRLEEMQQWLLTLADDKALIPHTSRLAIKLLLQGFRSIDDLNGLMTEAVLKITDAPREQALLCKAIELVREVAQKKRSRQLRQELGLQDVGASGPRSAEHLAAGLTPEALGQLETSNQEMEKSLGISVGWERHDGCLVKGGPRQTTAQLAAAVKSGQGMMVTAFLGQRELELKMETQRRSLPQVASALRCWHRFAVDLLSYGEEATLPPDNAADVVQYLSIFSNPGTAGNYLSALRWSCRAFGKSLAWNSPEIGVTIKGLKKRDVRTRLAELPPKLRLDEDTVFRLIKLSSDLRDDWSALACWSYHFLLRVQSEGIGIEAGSPADAQSRLPEERHSAIWIENDRVHLRLRRRKHRPQGSLMVRQCECHNLPDSCFCPVHCISLRYMDSGQRVFPDMTARTAKRKLVKYLSLLEHPGAQTASLRCFRGSKATNLALSGRTLPQVLAAGEWKSQAVLAYADEQAFDAGTFLIRSIENSSSDEAES